ncbi:MAG TPA: AI-2E family transporter [Thermoanaerobaculia bacterium]|nr:AI-2E family transporter [Thermoanaerobaculia bacterium]
MDPSFGPADLDQTLSRRTDPLVDKRLGERRATNARILTGSILVIAILYVARQVFIPIALAILFAFLLRPIVQILERTFLRRTGAIALSLGISVAVLFLGTWSLASQINSLAREVAAYSGNIERKLSFLKRSPTGTLALVERTLQRVAESTEQLERADLKVRVIPERKTLGDRYEEAAPTIEYVAAAFLVVVLVFFLLKDREALRDKILRLAGRANLTVTTQAIGEASHRISRYLLTIALLNIAFGLIIGMGLVLLQVPHAALWGVLSGLLRFIPYVGVVLAAAMPTVLALAVFPNWYEPLAVLVMFLLADQLLAGFIEPLVVGHRVGVSPIALLMVAIFWGWLWGPVGLLLATPITVCLTVSGEFIPALRVFSILFGTEAPLEGYLSFYNRLLLGDRAGAIALADRHAEASSMEATFSEMIVPTLTFAAEELKRARITTVNDHFIKDVTRDVIARLGDRNAAVSDPPRRVIAASVAAERLSLGTLMLSQLLRREAWQVDSFTELPVAELLEHIRQVSPEAVLLSCSNMAHLEHGHSLLAMLASEHPDLLIVAGGSAFSRDAAATVNAGATFVPAVLSEAKEEFLRQLKKSQKRPRNFSGQVRVPGV